MLSIFSNFTDLFALSIERLYGNLKRLLNSPIIIILFFVKIIFHVSSNNISLLFTFHISLKFSSNNNSPMIFHLFSSLGYCNFIFWSLLLLMTRSDQRQHFQIKIWIFQKKKIFTEFFFIHKKYCFLRNSWNVWKFFFNKLRAIKKCLFRFLWRKKIHTFQHILRKKKCH